MKIKIAINDYMYLWFIVPDHLPGAVTEPDRALTISFTKLLRHLRQMVMQPNEKKIIQF